MHAGDLGNVQVSGGKVQATLTSSTISLDPAASNSVVNRALVLHALEDDCGTGGFPDSNTTGHSGARIVCAVILAGLKGA
jgi:Cu-Zn family superoxide dismutase